MRYKWIYVFSFMVLMTGLSGCGDIFSFLGNELDRALRSDSNDPLKPGQQGIAGHVLDQSDSTPVKDASVTLGEYTTVTPVSGFFKFTGLEKKKYTLIILKDGYEKYVQTFDLASNELLPQGFFLVPTGSASEENVVPQPSEEDMIEILKIHFQAAGQENPQAVMETIHRDSDDYEQIKQNMNDIFAATDLNYTIENAKKVSTCCRSPNEVRLEYTYYMHDKDSPDKLGRKGTAIFKPSFAGKWLLTNQIIGCSSLLVKNPDQFSKENYCLRDYQTSF